MYHLGKKKNTKVREAQFLILIRGPIFQCIFFEVILFIKSSNSERFYVSVHVKIYLFIAETWTRTNKCFSKLLWFFFLFQCYQHGSPLHLIKPSIIKIKKGQSTDKDEGMYDGNEDTYMPNSAPPRWAAWSNILQPRRRPTVSKAIRAFSA